MATAEVYTSTAYNALPHLYEASDSFAERNPIEVIEKTISNLFLKYGVYDELAVGLIHRHFQINPNEKLVEFGAVSTPWPETNRGYVLTGGEIVPRSWMFVDGRLMPYEFGYNEATKAPVYKALPDKPKFYEELNEVLVSYGLTDLLGLQLNTDVNEEGTIKFEKTFERSNVMFTVKKSDELSDKEAISAQWVYQSVGDMAVPVKKLVCSIGCVCSRGNL